MGGKEKGMLKEREQAVRERERQQHEGPSNA